ncbi:MAG: ABC transporter ATP-binding protein/permease [Clostridiales bacterium]|nr:ABC transporter ATP-binding protein/permease [Clostridiales bacterium]
MPPRGPRAIAKPKNAKDTLRRLIRYLGRSRKQLILVACCILISTAASATGTFLLKPAVDGYLTPLVEQASQNLKVDLTPYLSFLMLLLAMYLAGAAAQFLSNRIMMMVSTGTLNHLRKEMFDHMEDLPIRYFDQRTHGEIMSRYTNDTDTLREFLSQAFPQAVSSALSILLSLAFMLNLNIWMTLLVLALTPLMFKITTTIGKKSGASFAAQQKAVGALNGYIEETIEGQRVVQVFCHEEKSIDEFTGKNEDVRVAGTRANTFASMLWPIMGNLGHAIYVLVALVGSIFIVNNAATLGTLIAFLPFTRQFSQPISNLSQQFSIIMQALAGAERIFELMDKPVEEDQGYVKLVRCRKDENGNIVETPERTGMWAWKHPHKADGTVTYTELRGDVVFEHVNFGYVPEKTVLHDVSLYAKPGQKIAFVGSTGAGKTTITNLINRFYDIQDGKIRYDGINIEKIKKDDLRRSLGMVLQDTHLFTGTVRDNIRYGKLDATDEEIRRAAKIANADFFIRHLPQGYDTMLTGDGANLSQGQRQLIAIARAAVADPPVLILDEATSSIDTRTEALIEKGMDGLMKGRTVFVIAHRLSTVRNSQAIMVLENGVIIERGNHEQLLEQKGKYYQLYTGMFELS